MGLSSRSWTLRLLFYWLSPFLPSTSAVVAAAAAVVYIIITLSRDNKTHALVYYTQRDKDKDKTKIYYYYILFFPV